MFTTVATVDDLYQKCVCLGSERGGGGVYICNGIGNMHLLWHTIAKFIGNALLKTHEILYQASHFRVNCIFIHTH